MIERTFYKANGENVESVTIRFEDVIPEFRTAVTLEGMEKYFREEAEVLAETLLKVLPGGTFDQLLCEMLRMKATHFRVAHK